VTAPWVTTKAASLIFDPLVARLDAREQVDVRIVYRLKGTAASFWRASGQPAYTRTSSPNVTVSLIFRMVSVEDLDAVRTSFEERLGGVTE
jgi:hypothetical protein